MTSITLIQHITGLDDPAGQWYAFWSGFGGDLVIFGGLGAFYHKHNCHQRLCPWIGKHLVDGTPYCTRHLPRRRP